MGVRGRRGRGRERMLGRWRGKSGGKGAGKGKVVKVVKEKGATNVGKRRGREIEIELERETNPNLSLSPNFLFLHNQYSTPQSSRIPASHCFRRAISLSQMRQSEPSRGHITFTMCVQAPQRERDGQGRVLPSLRLRVGGRKIVSRYTF